jgi:hypothetical protein
MPEKMEARGGNANQIIAGNFNHGWTQINTDEKDKTRISRIESVQIRGTCVCLLSVCICVYPWLIFLRVEG